jgi:putative transposase
MHTRFRGLSLTAGDRQKLLELCRHGGIPAWQFKRCRALLLLGDGSRISHVREKLGCADHNVRRWVRTYEGQGLDAALSRSYGGGVEPMLSSADEQRIVALACSSPPEGYARWSVRLLAERAGQVLDGKLVGRETIRLVLKDHDIKPWREKNVVRPKARRGLHSTDG